MTGECCPLEVAIVSRVLRVAEIGFGLPEPIRLLDGTIIEAELHWYEAHGIGKKEIKFKRPITGES